MAKTRSIGLVLEGGGMRGTYTAGALDFLLDMGLEFKYIIGVSAGACNAISYMTKQRGRSYDINLSYCGDRRYISVYNYLTGGSVCGEQFMFHEIPDQLRPFDYEGYKRCGARLTAVATDCVTGRPVYLPVEDCRTQIDSLRASSSLPMVSRMVTVDGRKLLDGGISDSIPIRKSMEDGNARNLVILTRPAGYQKKEAPTSLHYRLHYPEYPQLVRAMLNRPLVYNHSLKIVRREERAGRAVVLRPSRTIKTARMERNRQTLHYLYMLGYTDARAAYDDILTLCRGADNVALRGQTVKGGDTNGQP